MKLFHSTLTWLITLLIPFALIFLGIRLLLTHVFLEVEYHLPGFPPDEYGFTLQDRLHWSRVSVDYLLNQARINFLGDLTFPDGTSLFNGRELHHMLDVKNVLQPAIEIGYFVWFFILAIGLWARWGGWWREYVGGVRRGGWLTVGLVGVIGIFASVSFWQFFMAFHSLFFSGDSWLFNYWDTLIRLFPIRFWQDTVIMLVSIALGGGLALGLGLRPKAK